MKDFIPQETRTTASPFKEPRLMDFESLWEQFIGHAHNWIPNLAVDATNRSVLEAVLAYFTQDKDLCQKQGLNSQKGLFLLGPVGSGKSSLMRFFSNQFSRPQFRVVSTRDVTRSFAQEGFEVLDKYSKKSFVKKPGSYGYQLLYDQPITYCFDDLGVEQQSKYFGQEVNVMADILLDRYELFKKYGMLTHMTSNLNAEELGKLYGDRVRSRLRKMFNLVSFPEEAPDRRK